MGLHRFALLSAALLSTAAAAQDGFVHHPPQVPVWAPRSAFVGLFVNNIAVPQVRVGWEATLVDQLHDQFLFFLEGGGGYGLPPLPTRAGINENLKLTMFYEHTVMAGFGYRNDRPGGIYWGFHAVTGPVFTGAHFENAPTERQVLGMVEGRFDLGLHLGGAAYGISAGWGNPYYLPRRSASAPYVGGFVVGLCANWR